MDGKMRWIGETGVGEGEAGDGEVGEREVGEGEVGKGEAEDRVCVPCSHQTEGKKH